MYNYLSWHVSEIEKERDMLLNEHYAEETKESINFQEFLKIGGILTNICIWSGQRLASIIFTPFISHSFLNICPMSFFILPYITCLLYFGTNTIWYLQFHCVCAKLALSRIVIPPLFLCSWRTYIIVTKELLFSTHRHCLFRTTGIASGFL